MLTIRSATPEDWVQVADLCARSFDALKFEYEQLYERVYAHFPARPGFSYDQTRAGFVNGDLITHAHIMPYPMAYGPARLTVGGVAAVCTDEAHRQQGHAAAVMRDAIAYMEATGCDISLLHSRPEGYYDRFGYANVWPHYRLRVAPADAARLNPDRLGTALEVRDITPGDYPAMLALYAQSWHTRPGARIRTPEYLAWKLRWAYPYRRAAVDAGGSLRGYLLAWRPDEVSEVIAADEEATAALLLESVGALMAQETEEAARDRPFIWEAPPDAPVVRHVRTLCPAAFLTHTRPNADWMGRIVNLQSTVEKLLPALEARIARSAYAGWMGRLRLETDIGQVTLAFSQGMVALGRHMRDSLVTRMSQADLIQLLFGYITPQELAARQGIHFRAEVTGLLEALFPLRVCSIAGLDGF